MIRGGKENGASGFLLFVGRCEWFMAFAFSVVRFPRRKKRGEKRGRRRRKKVLRSSWLHWALRQVRKLECFVETHIHFRACLPHSQQK